MSDKYLADDILQDPSKQYQEVFAARRDCSDQLSKSASDIGYPDGLNGHEIGQIDDSRTLINRYAPFALIGSLIGGELGEIGAKINEKDDKKRNRHVKNRQALGAILGAITLASARHLWENTLKPSNILPEELLALYGGEAKQAGDKIAADKSKKDLIIETQKLRDDLAGLGVDQILLDKIIRDFQSGKISKSEAIKNIYKLAPGGIETIIPYTDSYAGQSAKAVLGAGADILGAVDVLGLKNITPFSGYFSPSVAFQTGTAHLLGRAIPPVISGVGGTKLYKDIKQSVLEQIPSLPSPADLVRGEKDKILNVLKNVRSANLGKLPDLLANLRQPAGNNPAIPLSDSVISFISSLPYSKDYQHRLNEALIRAARNEFKDINSITLSGPVSKNTNMPSKIRLGDILKAITRLNELLPQDNQIKFNDLKADTGFWHQLFSSIKEKSINRKANAVINALNLVNNKDVRANLANPTLKQIETILSDQNLLQNTLKYYYSLPAAERGDIYLSYGVPKNVKGSGNKGPVNLDIQRIKIEELTALANKIKEIKKTPSKYLPKLSASTIVGLITMMLPLIYREWFSRHGYRSGGRVSEKLLAKEMEKLLAYSELNK